MRRDPKGKRRCLSVIHRVGVPVVGGLSRFHRFERKEARPIASFACRDAITLRVVRRGHKGAVEKSGPP
jgi:hypothetical protein